MSTELKCVCVCVGGWGRRVRHIAYNCIAKGDARTAYLRNVVAAAGGLWRDVAHLSEPDLALLVRDDRVDILVDLTGHTANNRLGTLCLRPAPIQVLPPATFPLPSSSKWPYKRGVFADCAALALATWDGSLC